MVQINQKPVQKFRFVVQSSFALLCIWIGYDFYRFVSYFESGGSGQIYSRPPGVDGFLPISSFMSSYLFLKTGGIHPVHPAGVFIFLAIVVMSFVVGKSFCSWLCPVGFISEMVGDLGEKLFGKKIKIHAFLDYPLRSIKYLLLAFLFYSVFFLMTDITIKAFLDSPYNIVADIKMYYFFAKISRFSLIIISALLILSIVFKNFWCRYLCPYGALLGLISVFSPVKIRRNKESCIDCAACTKACPSFIKVHKANLVISDECTSCMNCIDVCPVKDTLYLKPVLSKKQINKKYIAIAIISVFLIFTGLGIATGFWQNNITTDEYKYYYEIIDNLGHPTDTKSIKEFEKNLERREIKRF